MNVKTIFTTIIAASIIFISPTCKPGEKEGKRKKDGVKRELLDEFVILAYSGPPSSEVNEQRYSEIAAAGIDVIVPGNGAFGPEGNLKALDLAQRAGIRVLPVDNRIMPLGQYADVPVDTAVIGKIISDYSDHPAFAGYLIRDEPATGQFPALGKVCANFRERDKLHEPLINLFPSYASEKQLGTADFRNYVRSFIDTVNPGVLSYDYYALRESETLYDGWYNDLAIVREETRKAGIPFWVFIQSEGIRDHFRIPDRSEILWQVNTAVAYGARGLGWFTYWTPEADQSLPQMEGAPPPLVEEHYGGILDIQGVPTPLYNSVAEANRYISQVGRGLAGWDNINVARFEHGIVVDGSSPLVKPFGDDVNLIIGTFSLGERRRVVLSNSTCDMETEFYMVVSEGWQIDRVIYFIDSLWISEDPSELSIIDGGGSMVLELSKSTK